MTNILVVVGHPDPAGGHLCNALADTYVSNAQASGHNVAMIDIAREEIPYLTSSSEWESGDLPQVSIDGQTALRKAHHIVIIYPLWMGDVPAKLKSWFELLRLFL